MPPVTPDQDEGGAHQQREEDTNPHDLEQGRDVLRSGRRRSGIGFPELRNHGRLVLGQHVHRGHLVPSGRVNPGIIPRMIGAISATR
jgi:hypothetical protein